jgi:hypothetical protein
MGLEATDQLLSGGADRPLSPSCLGGGVADKEAGAKEALRCMWLLLSGDVPGFSMLP